jgi:Kef-type K+ transport system membrane component KefB
VRSKGVVQALALSFCFVLSYLALKAGLASIVGAFAAGLVLEPVHFRRKSPAATATFTTH